jgi:uncharacterized protein (TIGR02996 family)
MGTKSSTTCFRNVVGGKDMFEDEQFIRAFVDHPGNDLLRMVYAEWLDERNDPRGRYLRAEMDWVKAGKLDTGYDLSLLSWLSGTIDPVWVDRVSRTPVGVCCDHLVLMSRGTVATPADLTRCEQRLGITFPYAYKALLLNYNDCQLSDLIIASVCERVMSPQHLLSVHDDLLDDLCGRKGALPVAQDLSVNPKNTVYIVIPEPTNAAVSEVYDYAEGGTPPEIEVFQRADSLSLWLNSQKHRQELLFGTRSHK